MLTPSFDIEQNNDFLILTIRAPYVKANDVEIYMGEKSFKFYVRPYFLRLSLPCEIVENGQEKAQYDIHTGVFTIHIPKATQGEVFPNLDMLTKLLAPNNNNNNRKPPIEVISNVENKEESGEENPEECNKDEEDEDFSWEIEQHLNENNEEDVTLGCSYGFAHQYKGVLSKFVDEINEIVDLSSPETTSPKERRSARIESENEKFDTAHYIADLFDAEYINTLVEFKPDWVSIHEQLLEKLRTERHEETLSVVTETKMHPAFLEENLKFEFTEEEKYDLMQLPKHDYSLCKESEQACYLGLVDVLLAYCYDHRTTEGEMTTGSAWTVCKLSSTLSWLEVFTSLKEVISSFAHRSLSFPLYRNWRLVTKCIGDVIVLLTLGKRHVLRCLLALRKTLQSDENRYVLNTIYLNDYCVWLQSVANRQLMSLSFTLQNMALSKGDIRYDLNSIEQQAWKQCMGESEIESENSSEFTSDSDDDSDDVSTTSSSESESDNTNKKADNSTNKKQVLIEELSKNYSCDSKEKTDCAVKSFSSSGDVTKKDVGINKNDDIEVINTGIEELLRINSQLKP